MQLQNDVQLYKLFSYSIINQSLTYLSLVAELVAANAAVSDPPVG